MKKLTIAVALGLALTACKEDAKEEAQAAPEALAQEVSKIEFANLDQKASYTIGQNFSKQMSQNFDSLKQYDIEIDTDLVVKGMKAGFKGEGQFTDQELAANMQEFQANLQAKTKELQEKEAAEAKVKAESAKAEGDAFRAEYAKQEGVTTTESGLMYKVTSKSESSEKPTADDTVKVHYKGTFIDGEEFDSSYSRNEPATFPLRGVIKGWTEGVQLMAIGDKFEFVIPADIAYGEHGSARIPGNSTLVFEIELLEINPSTDVQK